MKMMLPAVALLASAVYGGSHCSSIKKQGDCNADSECIFKNGCHSRADGIPCDIFNKKTEAKTRSRAGGCNDEPKCVFDEEVPQCVAIAEIQSNLRADRICRSFFKSRRRCEGAVGLCEFHGICVHKDILPECSEFSSDRLNSKRRCVERPAELDGVHCVWYKENKKDTARCLPSNEVPDTSDLSECNRKASKACRLDNTCFWRQANRYCEDLVCATLNYNFCSGSFYEGQCVWTGSECQDA